MIVHYEQIVTDDTLDNVVTPEHYRRYIDDRAGYEIGKLAIKEATVKSSRIDSEVWGLATQLQYSLHVFSDADMKATLAKEYERGVTDEHRRRFTRP